MRLRRHAASLALALLSSAARSSPPPAFTAAPNGGANGRRALFSARVRRRVLARSFLRSAPTDRTDLSSEFTSRVSSRRSSSVARPTDVPAAPSGGAPPSSALSMVVDGEREFELNLGRAVDTLRSDYPKLLTQNPSWDIYHADLEVVDPTGVSLHGLGNYKRAFDFIHAAVRWFYREEEGGMTSVRVGYDWARKCIRVSWNVELVPRMIYGGAGNVLHVDGISEYRLDRESGLITEHRVSHLLINDQPVRPENGVFHALAEISPEDPEGVPVYYGVEGLPRPLRDPTVAEFRTRNPLLDRRRSTSLFSSSNEQAVPLPPPDSFQGQGELLPYDPDALRRKNASRKKFGVPPMTPEEFVKVEREVRAMDAVNKEKAAYLAEEVARRKREEEKEGFLGNLFGGALKNGCESNFDCERPQVCCDLVVKKICCSNGLGIVDGIPVERYQRGVLRVPLPNDNIDY